MSCGRHSRSRATTVVALCATALVAACSGGEGSRDAPGAARRASAVASNPTFLNGGDCERASDPALPARAGCVTSVAAGGKRLVVYALTGRDLRPLEWRIHFETPAFEADLRLRAGTVAAYPRAAAVSDVDADGNPDWWWVKVLDYASHGATWGGLHVYVERGESLATVDYDGAPFVVNYGGISRLGEGAACRGREIVLLRTEAQDRQNTRWSASQRRFSVRGDSATLVGRNEYVLAVEDYNDPDLRAYFGVDCHGARFTPFGEAR